MPAPFNSPWNITTISDANLNGTTHGNGTTSERTAITNWAANRPFFDTTLKIWYCNTHASAPSSVTWSSISKDFNNFFYGTGVDGSATNPVLTAPFDKNYTDLTINANVTITGTGTAIIRCTGTLTVTGADLIHTANDYIYSGVGGNTSGGNSPRGGTGGASLSTLFIFAKTIVSSGTTPSITLTGNVGANGVDQPSANAYMGTSGLSGDKSEPWGKCGSGGQGSGASSAGNNFSGAAGLGGGDDSNLSALFKVLGTRILLLRNSGAGGGGGSASGGTVNGDNTGSGGGGAGNVIAIGGSGGIAKSGSAECGMGGGGGGATLLVIVTEAFDDDLLLLPTGGAGGAGSAGAVNGSGGSGGGGGSAGVLLISNIDSTGTTATGGAGGAGGALSGTGATGNAGSAGTGRKIFVSITDFKTYF